MKFIKSKKAMEMKMIMTWIFILISTIIVLLLIGMIYSNSETLLDILKGIF